MSDNPLVSIIIPVYNVEKYLDECLRSVINQSYVNLDIVLIDDGSTDNSLEICLKYASQDSRIFVVSKINYHQGSARNVGLEFIKGTSLRRYCEGEKINFIKSLTEIHSFSKIYKNIPISEVDQALQVINQNHVKINLENINELVIQDLPERIIHFLDSDDYLKSDCIKFCIESMIEKKLEIVLHDYICYNDFDNIFDKNKKQFKYENVVFKNGIQMLNRRNFHYYLCWAYCFNSEILNRYNLRFTHGIHAEDDEFGIFLFSLAYRVCYKKSEQVIYRIRVNSTMTSENELDFPSLMPKFLLPIQNYFKDYKTMRHYFRAYSHLVIASHIYKFIKDSTCENKKKLKRFIYKYTSLYICNYHELKYLQTHELLKKMGVKNISRLRRYYKIKSFWRNPKKIFNFLRNNDV
ncbi:glycosyltransferase family 2 protein [Campylobacter jejuni]|uniref:glycosyltransferase family 2 protein n=1 Tax=Campylobacter TaxID=194 RepID=UPI00092F14EC|nr:MULTISPECIES: glycosyltransferase family A protein [Campylobacter]ECQ7109036.1 glycosyltransferase family 2 protein [Campylobacter jejuni]EAW7368952.1 glycosyltransferase family 2 protein [Campylobacter coli]NGY27383.1 glycosyltransferase family 2 protein [Campylobacter sp. CFSAN093237]NGY39184.1 glycosyltransferase family 2 protein [Campylobacter sp. CFSAN093245]HEB8255745.1 glycosyltransferase family 2 protein [Campylobacter jejuni]